MACSYCRNNEALYKEDDAQSNLQFCSYTCQCVAHTIDEPDHMSLFMKALTLDAWPKKNKKQPAQMPKEFGPESELPHNIPIGLRKFMLKSNKYIGSLPLFKQYIVWRYTIGSASINTFLIFGKITNVKNALYWCYLFFLYWHNTTDAMGDGGSLTRRFTKFKKFFDDADLFKDLPEEKALPLAEEIIKYYISTLQNIIMSAPPVKTGFHVYKVASDYPGLPTSSKDVPKTVLQKPFNSTTINPHFNFAFFTSEESTGNLFDLLIPPGSHVLYVPADFHAYPFEKEVLLPMDCTFKITASYQGSIDVINKSDVNMITLQKPTKTIVMGPVYEIDQYKPCTGDDACLITNKDFTTFLCEYSDK